MEWADYNGTRIKATPGAAGCCPQCRSKLIPKCGEHKRWHWAHIGNDCDPWSEGETAWHKNWKGLFPKEWQEVVMGPHRADVCTPTRVLELQHSPIASAEIRERENFYGNMVWLFDFRKKRKNVIIEEPDNRAYRLGVPDDIKLFVWRWALRSIFACTKPVLVHLATGELYNLFGFGFYNRLNFIGGFVRRVDKPTFMAAIGAGPLTDQLNEHLYSFDAMPSLDLAKNWQPYWDDEREAHRKIPQFTIRSASQTKPKTLRVIRLPIYPK